MKAFIKHVLFALTAAYIALLPQFYLIFIKKNRYDLLWDHTYYGAILTSVGLLAAVYGTGYMIVFSWIGLPRPFQVARDIILILILAGLLTRSAVSILVRSELFESLTLVVQSSWAKIDYYVLLPALMAALNPFVVKRAVRRLYSCITPAVAIGLIAPLTFHTYDVRDPPIPRSLATQLEGGSGGGATNLFIFVMDEWSYDRTFPGDKPRAPMTRLRALLGQATFYHNARSPGPTTAVSIPRFLFQNNPEFRAMDYQQVRLKCASSSYAIAGDTIFSVSPPGWYRVAVGFWVDYPTLLGTNVDFAFKIQQEAGLRTYRRQTEWLMTTQFIWLGDLWPDALVGRLDPSLSWVFSLEQTHRWARMVIERMNQPTFALFHYCLPHYPYAWTCAGRKMPLPERPQEQTSQNYEDNLMYLDRVIGEIVDSLKAARKFDSSMIIFTSDHSWRSDPVHTYPDWTSQDVDAGCELRHVPLIIKFPGQQKPADVWELTFTEDLYLTIEKTLSAPANTSGHG